MSTYHIKPDGTVGKCSATIRGCPFGGDEVHYSTEKEALAASEKQTAELEAKLDEEENSTRTDIKSLIEDYGNHTDEQMQEWYRVQTENRNEFASAVRDAQELGWSGKPSSGWKFPDENVMKGKSAMSNKNERSNEIVISNESRAKWEKHLEFSSNVVTTSVNFLENKMVPINGIAISINIMKNEMIPSMTKKRLIGHTSKKEANYYNDWDIYIKEESVNTGIPSEQLEKLILELCDEETHELYNARKSGKLNNSDDEKDELIDEINKGHFKRFFDMLDDEDLIRYTKMYSGENPYDRTDLRNKEKFDKMKAILESDTHYYLPIDDYYKQPTGSVEDTDKITALRMVDRNEGWIFTDYESAIIRATD